MAKMTKDQVRAAVRDAIADAEGYDTDELSELRKQALDYYYNRESIAPTLDGRSKLQSSDVADMVEAVTAQIMPAFEGDSIVEVEPRTEDEIEQTRAETNAVNWVVMQQNNGHYELQQALRDALLLRNGVIKVYLQEQEEVEKQSFTNLSEIEYGSLVANATDSLTGVDNGVVIDSVEETNGWYDVSVTVKRTERQVCSKAVDPSYFMWERDWDSIYLDKCRFVAERSLPTRSELIEMGYPKSKVNKLNAGGNDTRVDALARNQNSNRRSWEGTTPAEDIIECHECYIR